MSTEQPNFYSIALATFLGAVIAVMLNFCYYFFLESDHQIELPQMVNALSVTLASAIGVVLGGITYFLLSRLTNKYSIAYMVIGIAATALSLIAPLQPILPDGSTAPEGFFALILPMHLLAGATAVFVIPRYVKRSLA